jgi:glycosyltransferase (activator-dependent family)
MRVLFVASINRSQVYLMTSLAWAMRTAGHQVRVAAQPDLAEHIAAIGLTPAPVGPPMPSLKQDMEDAEPDEDPVAPTIDPQHWTKPVQSTYGWDDPAAVWAHLTEDFYRMLTPDQFFPDLVEYARHWRPDLIIWNTLAFAGPVAARVTGAAHARMPWGVDAHAQIRAGFRQARADGGGAVPDPMEEWLGPILRRYGADFDEEIALGQWTIDPAPAWVYHHADAGVHYLPMRPVPFNGPAAVPDWVHEPPARKRVCVTLGFSTREGHGVEAPAPALLEAVADLDVEVVATFDKRQLDTSVRLPDNVRVVDFVPLGALLPSCSAIVHHGGPGSFATALEHGVPQLIVPNTYWHIKWWAAVAEANGLERRGAGVYVADSDVVTPERLRADLVRVLEEPEFARNAERLRIEAAGTPGPNEIVPVLEKLTAEHRAATGGIR